MPESTPTPAPAPTPAPTPAPADWFAGFDAETKGYLQNRGWDKKTAPEAFVEAAKAHREAEKHIGAPANELLRIPKPTDGDGVRAFWQRLGAPADAKGYDFTAIKMADGKDPTPALLDGLRAAAAAQHLPQTAAVEMAKTMVGYLDGREKASLAERTEKIAADRAALATEWKGNTDANILVCRNTAARLGLTPEAVQALENQIGYGDVMKMFLKVGTAIGEHKFVAPLNAGAPGVMSREGAVARKAELMKDEAWRQRYLKGGTDEVKEMTALNTIIVGDDTEDSRRK